MKNIYCFICLSVNKRTINICDTELQNVYENLANIKIDNRECWMCYICHTRLRHCHQLQQLTLQTKGLIDDILQNRIDIKFGTAKALMELSISKTNVTSSYIKQDSDGIYTYDDYGIKQNDNQENSDNYEEKGENYIKSEDTVAQELQNVSKFRRKNYVLQKSKANKFKLVEPIQIVNVEYAPQNIPNLVTDNLKGSEEQTWSNQSTENAEIKLEIKEEIINEGRNYNNKQVITNNCKGLVCASQSLSDYHKKQLSCYVCFKNFTYKSQLLSHIRTHTGEKPFSCDICSKKFLHKMNLKRHYIHMHTGEQAFRCDICSKEFSNEIYLNRHRLIHTDVKPFNCETCSKKFSQKIQLNRHKLIHTGEKPFSCDVCSKKFSHKSHLIDHKRIHSGDKPFNCELCSQNFTHNSTLKRHMQTHTGEQPFSCSVCSKKFVCKSSLNHHTLIHTGDKKHICHICGKKFALKRYLNIHLQSHTGVKRFSCDICSKRFTQKSSLNTHKRVH